MAGRGAVQLCGYLRASLRDMDKRLDLRTFYPAEHSRRRMRPTGELFPTLPKRLGAACNMLLGTAFFVASFQKSIIPTTQGQRQQPHVHSPMGLPYNDQRRRQIVPCLLAKAI